MQFHLDIHSGKFRFLTIKQRFFWAFLSAILLFWGQKVLAQGGFVGGASQMPRSDLTLGFYRVEVEVAATPEDRKQGLMHRRHMSDHQGMLFSFTFSERHCMWMKNTLLPLSVAFLDEQGVIVNIENMQPQTDINHCAAKPARYALEMNQGWFAQKGIRTGMRVGGLDRLPPAR